MDWAILDWEGDGVKISELIEKLQNLEAEHGDLQVDTWNVDRDRVSQRNPQIAYRKILTGRQSKPSFWSVFDGKDACGEKVIRL